ncbi:polyprenyl synthetase family protein [Streptomyces sp. TP-A0874]|uniref:polyprenyl synthetase family protein n=1 Tax=Streptomyces sp. TP-A0874 TaxID=549819 RepID=UPI000853DC4F|nr:polyprenyl synthetase family protein [Streptomyces sp. TP-A0874]
MSTLSPSARARWLLNELSIEDRELDSRLSRSLERAEQRLRECVADASDPYVAEAVGYLVAAGGKRLRPLLALLGAEFGTHAEGVHEAAVVAELVHVASLYHDDVMDEALTRHGVPSANARWGQPTAVFAGDWLLARAARLSARLGAETVRLQAEASDRLILGQLRELLGPQPGEDGLPYYFSVTAGKTAALISVSIRLGAIQAAAPPEVSSALAEYGEHLGIAFQISDDLLDITAPQAQSGKDQGRDLSAGVASLPVLLARTDDRPEGAELRGLLAGGGAVEGERHRRALELLQCSPAVPQARSIMNDRLAQARLALGAVPQLPAVKVLDALCDFVSSRTA